MGPPCIGPTLSLLALFWSDILAQAATTTTAAAVPEKWVFVTLSTLEENQRADASGVTAIGRKWSGSKMTFTYPATIVGRPSSGILQEWSNIAMGGRDFLAKPTEPGLQVFFTPLWEATVVDYTIKYPHWTSTGSLNIALRTTMSLMLTSSATIERMEFASTQDVIVAQKQDSGVFIALPPVTQTIFGQCSSLCEILIWGGGSNDAVPITRACTDGSVNTVYAGSFTGAALYAGESCKWTAPAGHTISGRAAYDASGQAGTAFVGPGLFQFVTPLPTDMGFVLLIGESAAVCTWQGGNSVTLTGAAGVFHTRLTNQSAGTTYTCDAPVTALGDADCPDHFGVTCTGQETNLIVAPQPLTTTTTTFTTTTATNTSTTTQTTSTNSTSTHTTVTTITLTATTVTSTRTTTTNTSTTTDTTATQTSTTTVTSTGTSTTTNTTTSTSATATATTSTATTNTNTTSTQSTTTTVTDTNTTSTTASTTTTATLTNTTLTATSTTLSSTETETSTFTSTTASSTNTTTTATGTTTTSSSTTLTLTSMTSTATTSSTTDTTLTTTTETATTSSTTDTTLTTMTETTLTATTLTQTLTTASTTATTVTTTSASSTTETASSTTMVPSVTATTLTDTTLPATALTAAELTSTITITTTVPPVAELVSQVEALEASALGDFLEADATNSTVQVGNLTLVLAKLDVATVVAAGGSFTVSAGEGTDVSVTVPASLFATLEHDEVVLVLAAIDVGEVVNVSVGESSERLEAAVNVNLYTLKGERLEVGNLAEPLSIVLGPSNSTAAELECIFWDEADWKWATAGVVLNASRASREDILVCEASHLTLFAVIVRGFTNTFSCSQAVLLTREGIAELASVDWLWTRGMLVLWGLLVIFLSLMVVAGRRDLEREREGVRDDEYFLIAMDSLPLIASTSGLGLNTSSSSLKKKPCWLYRVMAACGCWYLLDWCKSSAALRDALDDVVSNWITRFSEIRDFLEGLLEGLHCTCSSSAARGCGFALIGRIMSSTLATTARRQAAGACGISHGVSALLLENDDMGDVLLVHRNRPQPEDTGNDRSGAPVRRNSLGSDLGGASPKALIREEAWGSLHRRVEAKFDEYMEASARWSSLPGTVLRLFKSQNPFGACLVHCAFTSCKLRVLTLMVETVGALMLSTVFFAASGMPGKRNRSMDCKFTDPYELIGRIIAIGTSSIVIAGIPAGILNALSTRGIRKFESEGTPEWKRQLRVWRTQDKMIWVLGLLYLGFCFFFMALFLANVREEDHLSWLLSGLISLVEDTIAVPFAVALILPLLCTVTLALLSHKEHVKKKELISEKNSQFKRKSNMTFAIERI